MKIKDLMKFLWMSFGGVFLVVLCVAPTAMSQGRGLGTLDPQTLLQKPQGQWNINADRLSYDQNRQTYEGQGNVHVYSGDQSLRADWASLNLASRTVELRGNVRVQYGQDWLEGNHVVWDLDGQTGTVDEGLLYFSTNRFYVQGRSIEKIGPSQYALEDGFITSCAPDKPDWKLRYGRMKVNVEGVAWVRDTSFWARRVPLLYFPFVAFPVQKQRKSGFLIPWAGYSSLQGVEAEIPYFWAMRDDMDMTFYGRYMAERGVMGTAEYRVNSEKLGQGVWLLSYLHDQADKEHLLDQGYPYQTKDRHWLRSRHSIGFPQDVQARVDLDFVSDRNYLKEFERGASSWDFSNKTFRENSGRGILNDKNLTARESSIYVDKRFENSLLGLDTRYWDQLDTSLNEFTLQRLPSLSFQTVPSRALKTSAYYTLNSSLTHFWSEEGDRGNRLDAYPRLYYPLHWKSYLNVEPSVGGRVTGYRVDWDSSSADSWQNRFQGDVRLDVSSRLNRVYPLKWGDHVAFQHAIRPEIRYTYSTEGSDQNELPQFDRVDQDQFEHTLSYGFTNLFTSKRVSLDSQGDPVTTFHEFARLRLFQSFNIEPLPEDIRFVPESGKGFTSVGVRTDLMPLKYVTLTYDSLFYSTEREDISHQIYLTLNSGRGHMARFNYQFREEKPVDEFITETNVKILPQIYLSTYHNYSLEKNEMFKQGYGVRYFSGCWGVSLTYEKERDDQRVAVMLNLLGLGSLGTTFAAGGDSSFGFP